MSAPGIAGPRFSVLVFRVDGGWSAVVLEQLIVVESTTLHGLRDDLFDTFERIAEVGRVEGRDPWVGARAPASYIARFNAVTGCACAPTLPAEIAIGYGESWRSAREDQYENPQLPTWVRVRVEVERYERREVVP